MTAQVQAYSFDVPLPDGSAPGDYPSAYGIAIAECLVGDVLMCTGSIVVESTATRAAVRIYVPAGWSVEGRAETPNATLTAPYSLAPTFRWECSQAGTHTVKFGLLGTGDVHASAFNGISVIRYRTVAPETPVVVPVGSRTDEWVMTDRETSAMGPSIERWVLRSTGKDASGREFSVVLETEFRAADVDGATASGPTLTEAMTNLAAALNTTVDESLELKLLRWKFEAKLLDVTPGSLGRNVMDAFGRPDPVAATHAAYVQRFEA